MAVFFALGLFLDNMDMRLVSRKSDDIEHIAYETAVIGTQYLEKQDYGRGIYVFDKDVCMEAITSYLKKELNLDDAMTPIDGEYFTDTLMYTVYFYDDTGCEMYVDGSLTSSTPVSYPHTHNDLVTGNITIGKPSVIIILNAGDVPIHNKVFGGQSTDIIRYAVYQVTGRDY